MNPLARSVSSARIPTPADNYSAAFAISWVVFKRGGSPSRGAFTGMGAESGVSGSGGVDEPLGMMSLMMFRKVCYSDRR